MDHDPAPAGTDEEMIEQIVDFLQMKLNLHGNLPAAKAACLKMRFTPAMVDVAIQKLSLKRRIFEDLDPAPIVDKALRWYHGPNTATSFYWQDYRQGLAARGWSESKLANVDATTSRAVDLLEHPGASRIETRGLVFGRVQSGKTAHYTGVIAKAADCGYHLFIILSGITNSLRLQTQKRLNRDLSGPNRPQAWFWLTKPDIDGDFVPQNATNVNHAYGGGSHRGIAVVKKQPDVLRKLIAWLRTGNEVLRRDCPVLIIDDEADQASINTGRTMERVDLTTINRLIVDLLAVFPKAAYVGYTATPFANVLTHPDYPENLYPRSFLFPLDPPADYFGTSRVHGRQRSSHDETDEDTDGLPLIRVVHETELPRLRPAGRDVTGFSFSLTPSLERALRYFLMATAARLFREDRGSVEMDFSTMLIHTSQRVAVHRQTEPRIQESLERLRREIKSRRLEAWERIWQEEMAAVDRSKLGVRLGQVDFTDLEPFLFRAADRCKPIVSNSDPSVETNITFEEKGQIAIVIGGNTLSRGLTLEGLVVSYFVRSANAYDTILQMGRWFGYRPFYEDLPRIWLTSDMATTFHDLASIEEEFKEQLEEFRAKGLSPMQAAVRIRALPRIRITAANKMRFAVTAALSYGGARPQTIYFNHKDPAVVQANIEAARRLVGHCGAKAASGGRYVWHDRPASDVTSFLREYRFHERSRELDQKYLLDYIGKQIAHGRLATWNIAILGLATERKGLGRLDLGNGVTPNCINRAKLKLGDPLTANIKALMAPSDILCDRRDFDPSKLEGRKARDLFLERADDPSGLLILYPISAHSHKDKDSTSREDLGACDHLVGVALVFPDARGEHGDADYVQADLKPVDADPEEDGADDATEGRTDA